MAMTYSHAKVQGQMSFGSKDENMQTDGRTGGRRRLRYLHRSAVGALQVLEFFGWRKITVNKRLIRPNRLNLTVPDLNSKKCAVVSIMQTLTACHTYTSIPLY